jgi:hypothetical protein
MESVAVVGEYTTPSGPVADDHFLAIVLRSGEIVELTVGAEGTANAVAALEQRIGARIEFALANCTDAASRIIYPAALAERPLFDFVVGPSGFMGLLKRIRDFGMQEITGVLTEEVKAYLASSASKTN